jgi:hypothetical protein
MRLGHFRPRVVKDVEFCVTFDIENLLLALLLCGAVTFLTW